MTQTQGMLAKRRMVREGGELFDFSSEELDTTTG